MHTSRLTAAVGVFLFAFTSTLCAQSITEVIKKGIPVNPAIEYVSPDVSRNHYILDYQMLRSGAHWRMYLLEADSEPNPARMPASTQAAKTRNRYMLHFTCVTDSGERKSVELGELRHAAALGYPPQHLFVSPDQTHIDLLVSFEDSMKWQLRTFGPSLDEIGRHDFKYLSFNDSVLSTDGNALFTAGSNVGRDSQNAKIQRIDLATKEITDQVQIFTAHSDFTTLLPGKDGEIIAAGMDGKLNKLGAGESDVIVARLDSKNTRSAEARFPGMLPKLARMDPQNLAVLYNIGNPFKSHYHLRILDASTLKTVADIDQPYESTILQSAAIATGPGGTALIAVPDAANMTGPVKYQMRCYDKQGTLVRDWVIDAPAGHTRIAVQLKNVSDLIGLTWCSDHQENSPIEPNYKAALLFFDQTLLGK